MAEHQSYETQDEPVEIEVADQEVAESLQHGVMGDKLNYPRLLFWSLFGLFIFVLFVYSLTGMYSYNSFVSKQEQDKQTQWTQINQLRENEQQKLNSFGVINAEEGVYHIPIDSAIHVIATQSN
ncbi:MAG: hypothetical protein ACQETE_07505 [Bacteroidota bacterium]